MIDTRILALVVGTLSLAFGVWAATGAPSEVGLAAGALGFVTGLVALAAHSTRGTSAGAPDPSEPPAPAGKGLDHQVTDIGVTTPEKPQAPAETGFFDRDPTPDAPADQAPNVASHPGDRRDPGGSSSDDPGDAGSAGGPVADTPLTDPVTGLFSEDYLGVALEGRLASARRHLRPVALALLQVTQGLPDAGARPADPGVVAKAISETVRDSDIACRLSDGTFGMILEDTPENGAVWTVERIRRNLVSTSGHHTLWAGVACYPAHAFDADELMTQVREALDNAKEWNQDRIEVAIAE